MLSLFVALTIFAAAYGDSTNRIIGAEQAKEGEFPFVTSLFYSKKPNKIIAGSIVTKDWVLTTSDLCRIPADDIIVHSGSIYLDRGGTNRTAEKLIRHERAYIYGFDICLIRVSKPFEFNENVQPATLPKNDTDLEVDDVVTVAGWGATVPFGKPSNVLHKLDTLKVIDRDACEKELWLKLYPGVNCLRSALREEGICKHDIGDPVVKNGVLFGYISFPVSPCRNRVPAIATSIPFFVDWILEMLGPDAADLKFVD